MLIKGSKIKEMRKRAGLSQIELAKRLKIGNVYLNKIENDRVAGTLTRIKIMQYFEDWVEIPTLS